MQYELYSIEKFEDKDLYFYCLSTDSIEIIQHHIQNINNENYVLIDNYENPTLKYENCCAMLEDSDLLFECKVAKYLDIFMNQSNNADEILNLSFYSAKKEIEFLLEKN